MDTCVSDARVHGAEEGLQLELGNGVRRSRFAAPPPLCCPKAEEMKLNRNKIRAYTTLNSKSHRP